jgi:TM2 domain-containing membrane protein YozV
MLDPKNGTLHDAAMVTQARMYLAAVLFAKGEQEQAATVLERLLLDDKEQFEPDPLSFPTDVIDFFIDTRARLRDKLNAQAQERAKREAERRAREEEQKKREAARLALLERLATEEKVTSVHSRWIALVPFGAGQFQNGKPGLGWALLATESAFLLGTVVTIPIYLIDLQNRSDAYRAGQNFQANEYIDRANVVRTVNLAFIGAFALTAAAGVVQAQLEYVPSVVDLRTRPIPAVSWTLTPVLTPERGGASVGIGGRF